MHLLADSCYGALALHGGKPAVPFPRPHFTWPPQIPELGSFIARYVDGGGPLSIADRSGVYAELEDLLCEAHGRRYALLTSSGTMALYSAFFALGIEQSDEVVSTVYSFHATASSLLHLGARIVFCDVEPDTGNIDPAELEVLVGPGTRAVVTNHQWGHPVDCERVGTICRARGIPWVEDCSHAHFAEYRGRRVGSFGDVAVLSLQGNKLLTGGEGGVLLTDSREVYERATLLGHWLGRSEQTVQDSRWAELRRTGLGLKLRMHPLAAVIVLYLLRHKCLDWIDSRTRVLNHFESELTSSGLVLPMARRGYATSLGARYGFKPRLAPSSLALTRAGLVEALQAENVDVSVPSSEPFHRLALFAPDRHLINRFPKEEHRHRAFPGADAYSANIISLPTFTFDSDRPLMDAYATGFHKVAAHLEELL